MNLSMVCDECNCNLFLLFPDGKCICDKCSSMYEYDKEEGEWVKIIINECPECKNEENDNNLDIINNQDN